MKKIIVASIALALILPAAGVRAEDNRTEERSGFGTGLVLGAIAGGPAGAIVAGCPARILRYKDGYGPEAG